LANIIKLLLKILPCFYIGFYKSINMLLYQELIIPIL